MMTIPLGAVPVGASVKHVTTVNGMIDTDSWGAVESAYRPYQYPALVSLTFSSGKTVRAHGDSPASIYGL